MKALWRNRAVVMALVVVGPIVVAVPARTQTPQPAPPIPDSVRQMFMELQQVSAELEQIQEATLAANESLRQERAAAQAAVERAMVEADPQARRRLDRLRAIGGELREAQARQDTARMQALIGEAQQLQRELQPAQAAAMQREDVVKQVQAYQERLLAAMRAHDPRTDQLIARLESLARRIQAASP